MEKIVMDVVGMTCQGCVKNVTGVLRALPGVEQVEVSLESGQVNVMYHPEKIDVARFREAIEGAGFDIT